MRGLFSDCRDLILLWVFQSIEAFFRDILGKIRHTCSPGTSPQVTQSNVDKV